VLEIIAQLCGGIGLFLIGMILMTDSLKEMAGETLRVWLTKFTGTPFKSLCSGIGLTLIVQSSTATTLATIGFVGAGVLKFTQAIGVIIGANIGTTSTSWIVALLGVKFSIATFALPLIALGALLKLLTHGRLALFGLVLAGFGLIFLGIDQLQIAMSVFAEYVDLSILSYNSLWQKLFLVWIGLIMTILLQSSSAAITATLAALASTVIDLQQALLLVIGQNIGTVATALLAVIGSSVNAKRTAVVHVVFNVVSAVFAFFLLIPLFNWAHRNIQYIATWDEVIIVAAFHTSFSIIGACIFIPLIHQVNDLICKFLPEKKSDVLAILDESNLDITSVAIIAAEKVAYQSLIQMFKILYRAFQDGVNVSQKELQQLDEVIEHLESYLEKIVVPEYQQDKQRLTYLLRIMVYIHVLRSDLEGIPYALVIRTQPQIYQVALDFLNILDHYATSLELLENTEKVESFKQELANLKQWTDEHRAALRENMMQYATLNRLNAAKSLKLLAAKRWLDRLIAHTKRLSKVLADR
jgi:phosphate:Na+ symporter